MKIIDIKKYFKNLTATMLAIGVAVLSGAVGFYINEYQMREKLAIEHVGVKPLVSETTISPELRTLVSELDDMDRRSFSIYSIENDRLKVFDDDEVKAYLEQLINRRKKYESNLKEYSSGLSQVTTLLGQEAIDGKSFFKLSSEYLNSDAKESKENLSKIQVAINDKVQNTEDLLNKLNEVFKQLVADVYSAKSKASFQIDVILVNHGKTQSLLRNSGELSFGEDTVYLKKKNRKLSRFAIDGGDSDALNNFLIVKEKSFSTMTLVIDEYNNRKRMLDLAKREYLSGSRLATLRLYNSGGVVVLSTEILFRNDLEEERKVPLLDFIAENYSEYVPDTANRYEPSRSQ